MSVAVAIGVSPVFGGRPGTVTLPPDPSLSAGNGEVAVTFDSVLESGVYEIEVIAPAWRAGTYTATALSLVDGWEVLIDAAEQPAVPLIEGTPAVGQTLTGRPALVLYDPAIYPLGFVPTYQWRRNGVDIVGATSLSYTVVALDENAEITLAQLIPASAPLNNGGELVSAPVTVAFTTVPQVTFSGAQNIDLSPALTGGRRAIAFGARVTITDFAQVNRIIADVGTTMSTGAAWLTASNRIAVDADTAAFPITALNLDNGATPAAPDVLVVFGADLDRFGSDIRLTRFVRNGAGAQASGSRTDANAVNPADRLTNSGALRVGRNGDSTNAKFVWRGALWLNDTPIDAAKLRDALFEAVSTAVDPTGWRPRSLPGNGAVTIDGAEVLPLIYLAGPNFDQFNDAGTWRVPNKGRWAGNFTVNGGPFA